MSNITNELLKRISNLEYEVEEKERVIDKAIEFIEKEEVSITALDKGFGILNQKKYLLDILRGDKE